ncbi:MAG: beta-barrel assembly-enhancing protease [Gammaproteobacteria bacterium]
MKFTKPVVFLCVAFALLAGPASADEKTDKILLPDMGDSTGALITPAQEQELGQAFFRNLHTQVDISQDLDVQQYIEAIGEQLVAGSDTPANPFHFFVVMDNEVNAFAGPGGYIGVNAGLLTTTEGESELASVLAHEIAHVTQRHLYRAFEAASQLSIPTAAATLAAILLGTQSPAIGQAALMAIQAGSVQAQINFTRENEQEADRVGMQILSASNYDPHSMPIFFERLQQATRYAGAGIPEFLRTHPVTTSRISDTRGRADKYPYRQYPDSQDYLLTRAKLQVLMPDNEQDLQNYFKAQQHHGTAEQRAVGDYGIGLLHLKHQHFKEAAAIFRKLHGAYPEQRQYLAVLARTELDAGNYKQALELFKTALQKHPGNDAFKIEYATTLLKAGKPEEAHRILQTLSEKNHALPLYFELLARCYGGLNQEAESHRYMAEYYYLNGQTRAAITQIKLAQKSKDVNFYLNAILDERLRFFEDEEQERKRNQ